MSDVLRTGKEWTREEREAAASLIPHECMRIEHGYAITTNKRESSLLRHAVNLQLELTAAQREIAEARELLVWVSATARMDARQIRYQLAKQRRQQDER